MRSVLRRPGLLLLVLPALLLCVGGAVPPDLGLVGDFCLTERSGRPVTRADLLGKVWIASFVFTRCTGPCPQVTATLAELQTDLARRGDIVLVTFTVDPEHDTPDELKKYAGQFGADPKRWLFLTGPEDEIYRLMRASFHLYAKQTEGEKRTPGNEVEHQTKLVLVDRAGHIRGYFDGLPNRSLPEGVEFFEADQQKLRQEALALAHGPWYLPDDFPRFNATLNGISGVLIVLGYLAIRARYQRLHVACMLTALAVSALFLTSYLYYHLVVKGGVATRFADRAPDAPPWVAATYLAVLGSHTVLAVVVAPLALFTAWQGLRGRFKRHVRVARWALPLWLYVSVTGVVVYWMLYRLYPSP